MAHTHSLIRSVLSMIVLVFFFSSVSNAQFQQYNINSSDNSVHYKIQPDEEQLDGSPYYNTEWQTGMIYNSNNTFAKIEKMKYNVKINELVFVLNDEEYLVSGKDKIERFTLGQDEFIASFDQANQRTFYQVVLLGNDVSILKKYSCSIKRGEPSKGYIAATKDKYIIDESYFLKEPSVNAIEFNPKKGVTISEILSDKEEELNAYIKQNKLKMKSLEDAVELVTYYNSLVNTTVPVKKIN